ncbi:MAG: alanine racemase, partial [Ginsengibacter sp.]
MNWYSIKNMEAIDTPVLVIYRQRVVENILTAISMIGDVNRLRPHVKTHKSIEVAALQMNAGINKFKCATIAEAEMLGMAEAPDVLLAYQPAGPKLKRFIELIKKYPSTKFSCLVDNFQSIKMISDHAMENSVQIDVYIDLNVGMNRTGIQPGNIALELYRTCKKSGGIEPEGLHAYDGHIRSTDITERTIQCDKAFEAVLSMQEQLTKEGFPMPVIIAGGSPSFPVHAKKNGRECSPGTFVYWDKGYSDSFTEQHFLPAALVITRVISLPAKRKLCLDLGHKS